MSVKTLSDVGPLLSKKNKQIFIEYAVSVLDSSIDKKPVSNQNIPHIEGYDKIFITLMHNNSLRACMSGRTSKDNPIRTKLDIDKAIERCVDDKRFGDVLSKDEIKEVDLVFNIFYNRTQVHGDLEELKRHLEIGIHAIELVNGSKRAYFKESVPITKNFNLEKTLQRLCKKAGLDASCHNNSNTKIFKYETLTFKGNRKGEIVDLYRYNVPLDPDKIDNKFLLNRINLTKSWFLNNIDHDAGTMQYMYEPSSDMYSSANNHIRQLATLWSIGLSDSCFLKIDDQINIANSAFLILSLLNAPEYPESEKKMESLGKGIISLQNPDGSYKTKLQLKPDSRISVLLGKTSFDLKKLKKFRIWRIPFYLRTPRASVRKLKKRDRSIDFYPGEAMLTLMKLYQKNRDSLYLDSVENAFPFYREYWRKNKNTAFIPWHTQTYLLLYEETRNAEIPEFVFEMNDWIIDKYQIRNSSFPDKIGGFGKLNPGVSTSVFLEGINDAYLLAKIVKDKHHIRKYTEAIRLGIRFMLLMQYTNENAFYIKNQSRAIGGFRQSLVDNRQRIDHTQHSLNALMKTYDNGIFGSKGSIE
jgi:uncharacterized protein (TIGR00296 family)